MKRIRSSRLSRTSERQNKKQAVLFSALFIVLIIILIQFGPFLINIFGNIVYTLRGGDTGDQIQIVGDKLFQPPILSGIPNATNSARISFSGVSTENEGIIEVYVNNELEEEIELSGKKEFEIKNIRLAKGANSIKARFSKGDETSGFGEEHNVSYVTEEPTLEVTFPSDGSTFTRADRSITVTGKTDPDTSISVNSFRAIVDNTGKFSYLLQLNDGENNINVEAQNLAGITARKTLKVTYTP